MNKKVKNLVAVAITVVVTDAAVGLMNIGIKKVLKNREEKKTKENSND